MSRSLIAILLVAVVGIGCAASSASRESTVAPLDALPAVTLKTVDGQARQLDEARAQRPALVNFWATWCEACVAELPALTRLAAQAPAAGVAVLGIDVGESHQTVAGYLTSHPLGYLSLVDEEYALTDAIGARRIPTTLVLDRQGHIVYRGGALDQGALDALARVSH